MRYGRTVESEYLPGGSGGVWRIAAPGGVARVHRPTGAWTPAVHGLLDFLRARDLPGIPKVHGFDDEGREVLDYLPGVTLDPETDHADDRALAAASAWLRRFHDTVRDYDPGTVEWRQGARAIGSGEVICHNDPGLYNWVVVEGGFAGMIDWDRAGPGRPVDDLAFLCWSAVPLLREIPAFDAARRIALAARAYGGIDPGALLDAVDARMELISERWRAGIERGDPGTIALRDSGIMDRHAARVRAFGERRGSIARALRVRPEPHPGQPDEAGAGHR